MEIIKQLTLYKWRHKSKNVKFGLLARIGQRTNFEGWNSLGKLSFYSGKMGRYSYIGDNAVFMGNIGRYTSISSNVHIINGRHPLKQPYVSTSPVFYSEKSPIGCSFTKEQLYEEFIFADKEKRAPIIVGSDCWIGYGASIIEGITIGDGAVVLANATVTKDVPPFSIVGGVPAKVIGYRYDDAVIEKLLYFKWWEKDETWIKEHANAFSNIELFLNLIK